MYPIPLYPNENALIMIFVTTLLQPRIGHPHCGKSLLGFSTESMDLAHS